MVVLALAACSSNPAPGAPQSSDPCAGARVQLWDDASFAARRLTVEYPTEIPRLDDASSDSGDRGFNDRVTSAMWTVPVGCRLVLYEDAGFRGARFELVGTGRPEQNANLGPFSDRVSSVRWERG